MLRDLDAYDFLDLHLCTFVSYQSCFLFINIDLGLPFAFKITYYT